ncbi:divalent metal cation transporter [soil metagenome]
MSESPPPPKRGCLFSVGPAIIVAAVVLGPGSILSSSKVGAQEGYSMLWVLALAGILMAATVALGGRLGLALERSPCGELAARLGRPVAAALGIIVFLIVACFQASNNLAVLAALEGLVEIDAATGERGPWPAVVLVSLNALLLVVLFGLRGLYRPVEKAMMVFVLVMVLGFLANLVVVRPSLVEALRGLVPALPEGGTFFATKVGEVIVDRWWAIGALFATTFSVVGAFYQGYLVREKGWTVGDLRRGLVDAVVGIAVLAGLTATIMMTAASAFYGKVDADGLKSATDVAAQLEPTFGATAKVLFSMGILAGALSSFLVNAMVGGHILADGLGYGGSLSSRSTRVCTAAALLFAMGFALWASVGGGDLVTLILIAQGMTLLGIPALAVAMLYLVVQARRNRHVPVPAWMLATAAITLVISMLLAVRTGASLLLRLQG